MVTAGPQDQDAARTGQGAPLIVLTGPPGAGKSTVARALAARLGLEVADTDDLIVQRAGRTITEIFADDGEAAFRALEREVVAGALASRRGVLALGGGAVLDEATQELLGPHRVVFLDVSLRHAARRSGFDQGRPLLALNPRGQWIALMEARRPVYERLASVTVSTDERDVAAVVDAIIGALASSGPGDGDGEPAAAPGIPGEPEQRGGDGGAAGLVRIHVGPPEGPGAYDVLIGDGTVLAASLAALLGLPAPGEPVQTAGEPCGARPALPGLAGVARVLIVHAGAVAGLAGRIRDQLAAAGLQALLAPVPDGEEAKTAHVAAQLWSRMGQAGFTRSDLIIAVGGGSVTDLGGFVAATWLRGVPVIQVPTTLLGMVDAAVGGKTGINTAEGKNLVGAFYPPRGVLIDTGVLATLPPADLAAGLAEVVKTGFIADPRILELIEASPQAALDPASGVLRELIERSIAVKARVVTADLRESSLREILNYGHTFAHAIENLEHYRWRHGDAVSAGMVFAAELACRAGLLDEATVRRHRRVLASLGLPVTYSPGGGAAGDVRGGFQQALAVMRRDKKTRGSTLRFVVLRAVGEPDRLTGPDEDLLRAAYEAVTT